ncbi:MAG: hypothetical protein ABR54_06125 [Actinobacteria bacterium BACL15 MAG-120619-bin91]|uniref:Uncharacterized protein n=1 Tax=Actinobacteria bacterium BACL15 MAG-120619-bin91 TaxID=1655562 RepID=A0A0R2PET7_9ACTN|nr:MAG: hypothetical protein ABR54_06125 [Actinobacteria bacterium BACL15 MAG-120619-bin91]
MFELIALTALIYLFLSRKKKARKPRTLDAELKQLIQESDDATAIGSDIKRFLLDVLSDNANDLEKFSDTRIAQAQRILDRAGPASFYWMTEIAAQLATLAAAQINGIPTNVNAELRGSATPKRS